MVYNQIAVIIPVYNAAPYISECLESLIAQEYSNWTAYCVDDGSTDESPRILDDYAKLESKIKVFHKSNGGASSARNYALDNLCNEDWVSFIDIDDYVSPFFFKTIIDAVKDESDIDYVRLFCTHTPCRYAHYLKSGWLEVNINSIEKSIEDRNEYFLKGNIGGYVHSLFVKSEIITYNKFRFPEDMTLLEDQLFSITCALNSRKVLVLHKPNNYFYYSGNTSSITKSTKDSRSDIIKCINRVYGLLADRKEYVLIDKFFYKNWLGGKWDSFITNSLNIRHKYTGEPLSNEIRIRYMKFPLKLMIKICLAKILRLI